MAHSYQAIFLESNLTKSNLYLSLCEKKTRPRTVDLFDVFLWNFICFKKWLSVAYVAKRNILNGNFAITISSYGKKAMIIQKASLRKF